MKKIVEMPGDARVWIYQAERQLTSDEEKLIWEQGASFIDQWSSHGQAMDAALEVMHHRFVVITADEKKALASGCGIDKSVHFMRDLGARLGVDFFKRTQVLYRQEGELKEAELNVFWAMRKAGLIDDSTIVFDNTAKNVQQLLEQWELPFSKSWHAEMWLR